MSSNLFFNADLLPPSKPEFVLWCDCMGTGMALKNGMPSSANTMFRIHAAFSIAQATNPHTRVYPVMDGVYATCPNLNEMLSVIRTVFTELGQEFLRAKGFRRMNMVRAGLAYGGTLHGADIPDQAFYGDYGDGRQLTKKEFEESALYHTRSQILLSPAMVHAYQAEGNAPPFGIALHESSKTIPPLIDPALGGLKDGHLKWWWQAKDLGKFAAVVGAQVEYYLRSSLRENNTLGYPKESILRHQELASEYFGAVMKKYEAESGRSGD